jgi:hypothetical protein
VSVAGGALEEVPVSVGDPRNWRHSSAGACAEITAGLKACTTTPVARSPTINAGLKACTTFPTILPVYFTASA